MAILNDLPDELLDPILSTAAASCTQPQIAAFGLVCRRFHRLTLSYLYESVRVSQATAASLHRSCICNPRLRRLVRNLAIDLSERPLAELPDDQAEAVSNDNDGDNSTSLQVPIVQGQEGCADWLISDFTDLVVPHLTDLAIDFCAWFTAARSLELYGVQRAEHAHPLLHAALDHITGLEHLTLDSRYLYLPWVFHTVGDVKPLRTLILTAVRSSEDALGVRGYLNPHVRV